MAKSHILKAKKTGGKGLPMGKGKGKFAARQSALLRARAQAGQLSVGRPSLRRLARRGGVKRMAAGSYDTALDNMRAFVDIIVDKALCYTEHARRKTITTQDVVLALKRHGKPIYGF